MSRKKIIAVAAVVLIGLAVYGTGIASQLIYAAVSWLGGDSGLGQGLASLISGTVNQTEAAAREPLNIGQPQAVFAALFNLPYNFYGLAVIVLLAGLIIIFLMKNNSVQGTMDNERNLVYSNKGTYGTAGWMSDTEFNKELEATKDLKSCRGTILGELNGKAVCVPENTMMNRNVAVYGAAGSMKSRAYVRNMVFQCVRRGESLIITDPKSELYASMAEYLRDMGYVVRVFNLISPESSDSWNCLREIEGDNQEFMAQIFCDVVIRNTLLNGKMDPFWDTGAISLLKALCLYVVQVYPEESRNIGEVYKLLANAASAAYGGGLKAAFAALPFGHSARVPYDIFTQASDNVQSGIIIGLANRIQVFQIEMLRTITSHSNGIDLTLPGKERCAYFCITSDQDSTFDFLSSLFLSFLFIKLVRFADSQPTQTLPVAVHLLADELANIGVIPDLTKKISTVRSRKISMSVIFQNIAQMKNRYPNDAWLEILGNCDTQLFLGCTDEMTAKFISDRTGEVTIGVESTAKEMNAVRLSNYVPSHRETSSIGKRKLLTPDEVLRLHREDALIIFRGQKVLRVKKFDYTKHPESKKLRDCKARDYIPNWRLGEAREQEAGEQEAGGQEAREQEPREQEARKQEPSANVNKRFGEINIDDVLSDL
ncbi:MAG: type IV secretory system conjugative DNA transfer family protein [Defluviitaleaceae bacterium]|nr:type IV secretory system conjugative DNA transfer family protein [Defluviitaleaceae bacterium]